MSADPAGIRFGAEGSAWKYLDDGTDPGPLGAIPRSTTPSGNWVRPNWGSAKPIRPPYDRLWSRRMEQVPDDVFSTSFDVADPHDSILRPRVARVTRRRGRGLLNGREVFREIWYSAANYRHLCSSGNWESDETTFLEVPISPNFLVPGTNSSGCRNPSMLPDFVRPQLRSDVDGTGVDPCIHRNAFWTRRGPDSGRVDHYPGNSEVADKGDASEISLIRLSEPESLGDNFTAGAT